MSQIPLEAENEFYAAMEREDAEQLEREARSAASARLNALALQLKKEFSTAESSRKLIEERWLEDLMQYRGQYAADTLERLKKSGSRVLITRDCGAVTIVNGKSVSAFNRIK